MPSPLDYSYKVVSLLHTKQARRLLVNVLIPNILVLLVLSFWCLVLVLLLVPYGAAVGPLLVSLTFGKRL